MDVFICLIFYLIYEDFFDVFYEEFNILFGFSNSYRELPFIYLDLFNIYPALSYFYLSYVFFDFFGNSMYCFCFNMYYNYFLYF